MSEPQEPRAPRRGRLARRVGIGLAKLLGLVAFLLIVMQVVAALRAPDLPAMAPEFTLRDLDGQTVNLSDYRGQMVVLNFWATWCGPCKLEVPAFARFSRAHPDIAVLGLASDNGLEVVREAARDLEIPYRVLLADSATLRAYDIDTFPTTVIVGPDGEVRRAYTGMLLDPHLLWATR